jgi:hypothetical protein
MKQKAPSDYRGLNERDLVFSSSDPGETRTHDQWFSQPKMLLINKQMGLQYLILRHIHL